MFVVAKASLIANALVGCSSNGSLDLRSLKASSFVIPFCFAHGVDVSHRQVCAVKAPGFGDNRKATLQDIAVLTGGTVVSEEVGLKVEEITPNECGTCRLVRVHNAGN